MRLDLEWDRQQAPVIAHCSRCGGEIYQEFAIFPGRLCAECWEEEDGKQDCAESLPTKRKSRRRCKNHEKAQSVLEELMREHKLSARYIVSQMIIQGADFIEIEEEL